MPILIELLDSGVSFSLKLCCLEHNISAMTLRVAVCPQVEQMRYEFRNDGGDRW